MTIFNTHTHAFKLDHVPDHFYSKLSIRNLKRWGILHWLMRTLHKAGVFPNGAVLDRLAQMLGIIDKKSQEDIFGILQSFYPDDTRFVILSMDMEHMGAGNPAVSYFHQLEELAELKSRFREKVYPFVCADPRNPRVTETVKHYISERGFAGIKLYPALGYYPFDIRLHDIYRFALEKNLPIIVHCSKGPVYYRGDYTPEMLVHPVTGERYTEKGNSELSWHYSDPANYQYLMDKKWLQKYMDKVAPGTLAPDFSQLKISMGHFGGDKEISKFLSSGWDFSANKPLADNNNWFSTIRDLVKKFDHFYADVSYTWEDPSFNNILKIILEESREGDQKLYNRVLFGTDYFLVSMETSEKQFAINLRASLGEITFHQISSVNPRRFLH